jgi:hypothetical protein
LTCTFSSIFSNREHSAARALIAVSIAGALVVSHIGAAIAMQRQIVIVNDTQSALERFFANDVGQSEWGGDRLDRETVHPGGSIEINFDDESGYCMFDFRGEFADGDVVEKYRVDICQLVRFHFHD